MMAAKKKETSLVPVEITQPVILPPSEWLTGVNKLEVKIQDRVRTNHFRLVDKVGNFKQSIAIDLIEQRKLLLPVKLYEQYLKGLQSQDIISRATANRYVRKYEYMQLHLPAQVFEQVLKEDIQIDQSLIEHIPPPKGDDPEENNVWLSRVRKQAKKLKPIGNPTEHILKDTFAVVKNAYGHVPKAQRQAWVTDLCSAALHMLGVTTGQTIKPAPLPDRLLKKRGRPRKEA